MTKNKIIKRIQMHRKEIKDFDFIKFDKKRFIKWLKELQKDIKTKDNLIFEVNFMPIENFTEDKIGHYYSFSFLSELYNFMIIRLKQQDNLKTKKKEYSLYFKSYPYEFQKIKLTKKEYEEIVQNLKEIASLFIKKR